MSAVPTTAAPRKYKRLDARTWAEVEGLWAAGAATLAELEDRYGVTTRAMQVRFRKAGITKGEAAASLGAAVRAAVAETVLPDTDDLAARAVAIRERAFDGACQIEAMLMAALNEAAADPSKLFALTATAKATALAAQTLERLHTLKRSALGITDENANDDELPILEIVDLTQEDIRAMREEGERED